MASAIRLHWLLELSCVITQDNFDFYCTKKYLCTIKIKASSANLITYKSCQCSVTFYSWYYLSPPQSMNFRQVVFLFVKLQFGGGGGSLWSCYPPPQWYPILYPKCNLKCNKEKLWRNNKPQTALLCTPAADKDNGMLAAGNYVKVFLVVK